MKLPEGTTQAQWDRYSEDMKAFEAYCERCKPVPPPDYFTGHEKEDAVRQYERLYSEWEMMCSCSEPNKPGYYRANND